MGTTIVVHGHLIGGIENNNPDQSSGEFLGYLDPIFSLPKAPRHQLVFTMTGRNSRFIEIGAIDAHGQALAKRIPRELLDHPPITKIILAASAKGREMFLQSLGECTLEWLFSTTCNKHRRWRD